MLTIQIDNAILSHNSEAIEEAAISMTCSADMDIQISVSDYHKLRGIIDEGDIHIVVPAFDSLEYLADWLNEVSDLIANGYIRWDAIQDAVQSSGWEFNAADVFVAYDNNERRGVKYVIEGKKEIAVIV